MSKVGVKIAPTSDEKVPTTKDNKTSAAGLNGIVNGATSKKLVQNKNGENHRQDETNKSEIVAGTRPKKKNRKHKKESVEEVQELTKLDLCSILNRCREPVASTSRAVNTETLIDDLKELNLDADLSDIACGSKTVDVEKQAEEQREPDVKKELPPVEYVQYESELQMPLIMKLIQKDLSEPYSIYTYRYFIHNWPKLCFLVRHRRVRIFLHFSAFVTLLNLHIL